MYAVDHVVADCVEDAIEHGVERGPGQRGTDTTVWAETEGDV